MFFARRFEKARQVLALAHAGFAGHTVGIGLEGSNKLLDLFSGLVIAQRLALAWLDVIMHLRIHPAHPKYLLSASEAATLWLKLTRAGEESFCLRKSLVHFTQNIRRIICLLRAT